MLINFFDGNLFLGRPLVEKKFEPISAGSELITKLDGLGIEKALVWHISQYDASPIEGNPLLSNEIKAQKRLFGCWTILPPQTGEVITPDFFQKMKDNRIVALRTFPVHHHYLLQRVVFGKFLDEVSERRIPLIVSMEKSVTSWADIYQLFREYPKLTGILCDIGTWNVDRYTWPLLETYPNLFLETSLVSLFAGGLEAVVNHFGAERLIFGTGLPERYPEAATLSIMRAEISAPAKEKIASVNLEKLISNIEL